jgi:hypothetical protein
MMAALMEHTMAVNLVEMMAESMGVMLDCKMDWLMVA